MSTETDYLIIGAGAMGVAFADEIFSRNDKLTITLVDRREAFGGHWVDAYEYVKLHQPAAFYGVNSLELGNGGTNLSSKEEILSYYQKVYEKFQASGRVTFYPAHEYLGNNQIAPLDEPENISEIKIRRKLVDATYMKVEVPATHAPKFMVDEGVPLVPLNDLIEEYKKWERFCVVGNGKTGMDAILFLLEKGIDPDKISWVAPNDSWLFNRSHTYIRLVTKELLTHADFMVNASKPDDVFLEMEKRGGILRLDKDVLPTKWRCATVSESELHQLQRIKHIIRLGRISRITKAEIQLEKGNLPYAEGTLFVNCTADGLAKRTPKPIFSGKEITLQAVIFCQQVFSAAIIARLELASLSDRQRNKVTPVPHPEVKDDWPTVYFASIRNLLWLNRYLPLWMRRSRLFFMSYETPIKYLSYSLKAVRLFLPLRHAAKRMS